MKIKPLLTLSFLFLLSIPITGWSAIECRFGNGSGGTSVLVNGGSSNNIRWAYSQGPGNYSSDQSMNLLATVNLSLSPSLTSNCSTGNDGEVLKEKADTTSPVSASPLDENAVLYPTNISGIYFNVKIYSSAGGGFFKNTGTTNDGWETLEADHNDERWRGKSWSALIKIYQDNSRFYGNKNKLTTLTPGGSFTLGQMAIGDRTDSNNKPWTFTISPTSFQIPIIATTCQATALAGAGGANNIDLGEYMLSDFNASPKTKTFNVELTGCNNLFGIDVKITSNKTTGSDNSLLGNTLTTNAAAGVGVKLYAGSWTQLVPNVTSYTQYSFDTGSGVAASALQFQAQLVKDGNTMKAGEFKAATTITMNYF